MVTELIPTIDASYESKRYGMCVCAVELFSLFVPICYITFSVVTVYVL